MTKTRELVGLAIAMAVLEREERRLRTIGWGVFEWKHVNGKHYYEAEFALRCKIMTMARENRRVVRALERQRDYLIAIGAHGEAHLISRAIHLLAPFTRRLPPKPARRRGDMQATADHLEKEREK